MPQFAVPPEDEDPLEQNVNMRWIVPPGDEPQLIEVEVGSWWRSTDLGRRIRCGELHDVELQPTSITEHIEPDPPGTPVVLGPGTQILRTCEFPAIGSVLFDE